VTFRGAGAQHRPPCPSYLPIHGGGGAMTDQARPSRDTPMPAIEVYTQQHNSAFVAEMAARTAAKEAAFFLPHLRPGMQLLDVGCGPGSITLGLAGVVGPGVVVGIDVDPTQVEQARALALERGVTNVRFEVADLYRLPFPDGSFDAAFAHTVIM